MAYAGWFALGDGAAQVEIINVARTEAYARNAGLDWFVPVYQPDSLAGLLGDDPYQSPQVDDAPWYDPSAPESNEFYGFYPTTVTGLEDSTRESDAIESTLDGGLPGRLRYGMRQPVFAGVLIGSTERGIEYGFRWLDRATKGKACLPGAAVDFTGKNVHYLAIDPNLDENCRGFVPAVEALIDGGAPAVTVSDPLIDGGTLTTTGTLIFDGGTPTDTGGVLYVTTPPFEVDVPPVTPLTAYKRFQRRFKITNGPRILAKSTLSDGSAIWNVQMTGTGGIPFEFGEPVEILRNALGGGDPYAPGVSGSYNMEGYVQVDPLCASPIWTPVYNPNCLPVSSPPTVPVVQAACADAPDNWWRRQAQIPSDYIPVWGDAVPVVTITAPSTGLTQFRVRIFADLSSTGLPGDNPCTVVADFYVPYVPAGMELVIDGVAEGVYVLDPSTGSQRKADTLVSTTDGLPFEWPVLTCGLGYIATFDNLGPAVAVPNVGLSLVPRAS